MKRYLHPYLVGVYVDLGVWVSRSGSDPSDPRDLNPTKHLKFFGSGSRWQ